MGLPNGRKHLSEPIGRTDHFQTKLVHALTLTSLADGRIRSLGAEECALARSGEGALLVGADVARTGLERSRNNRHAVGRRREHDYLERPGCRGRPERPHIDEPKPPGEAIVDSTDRVVE